MCLAASFSGLRVAMTTPPSGLHHPLRPHAGLATLRGLETLLALHDAVDQALQLPEADLLLVREVGRVGQDGLARNEVAHEATLHFPRVSHHLQPDLARKFPRKTQTFEDALHRQTLSDFAFRVENAQAVNPPPVADTLCRPRAFAQEDREHDVDHLGAFAVRPEQRLHHALL